MRRHEIKCQRCKTWTDPRISWWRAGVTAACCPECGHRIELPDPDGALWRKLGPQEAPKSPEEPVAAGPRGLFDSLGNEET